MDQKLEYHDDILDNHGRKLDEIQKDVIDLKVRLGIKDKTNGQVLKYQEELVEAQQLERTKRKEEDARLHQEFKKLDERTWAILTGVILTILIDIGLRLFGGG